MFIASLLVGLAAWLSVRWHDRHRRVLDHDEIDQLVYDHAVRRGLTHDAREALRQRLRAVPLTRVQVAKWL